VYGVSSPAPVYGVSSPASVYGVSSPAPMKMTIVSTPHW